MDMRLRLDAGIHVRAFWPSKLVTEPPSLTVLENRRGCLFCHEVLTAIIAEAGGAGIRCGGADMCWGRGGGLEGADATTNWGGNDPRCGGSADVRREYVDIRENSPWGWGVTAISDQSTLISYMARNFKHFRSLTLRRRVMRLR